MLVKLQDVETVKQFKPFDIVLRMETAEEAETFRTLFNCNISIPNLLANVNKSIDTEKLRKQMHTVGILINRRLIQMTKEDQS